MTAVLQILLRHQLPLFLLILIIPGIVFIMHIKNLLPLYTDPQTRNSIQSSLMQITAREGWLLSDIQIEEASANALRLIHREHHQGTDPQTCFVMALPSLSLTPCT